MTTAEIEAAANRGDIATADFVVGQVLRRQVIPQFLEDVGPCSWRKAYKSITTAIGDQDYDLDTNFLKVHEAYRVPTSGDPIPLKYIGEDPTAVMRAEVATTNAIPTGYYVKLNGAAPGTVIVDSSASLSWSAIPDGDVAAQTFTMAGASVGDTVYPGWPSTLETGLVGIMRVSAANTIEVRLANLSGASVTPATQTFSFTVVEADPGTPTAAWQALKLQAPADAAYSLLIIELTFIPFADNTTDVGLSPFIPEQFHWALVEGLRAQIFFDRFGQNDPRYDRAQASYAQWVERTKVQRELGRRNYFQSVR